MEIIMALLFSQQRLCSFKVQKKKKKDCVLFCAFLRRREWLSKKIDQACVWEVRVLNHNSLKTLYLLLIIRDMLVYKQLVTLPLASPISIQSSLLYSNGKTFLGGLYAQNLKGVSGIFFVTDE